MDLPAKLQKLNELRPLSPESVASLAAAWDVQMVYESNSIEGNTLTLRETEIVLSQGVTVSGKPLKDHVDAVQLAKAWDEVKRLAQPGEAFTERHLLDLRAIVLSEDGGAFRQGAVRIAGSNLVPPNAIKVPDLVAKLFSEVGELGCPIAKAAKVHHGVSAIHPFYDGNGRTARLAMNFILIAVGYPPISISPDKRQAYYAALESADGGDFALWQAFLENELHREFDTYFEALAS